MVSRGRNDKSEKPNNGNTGSGNFKGGKDNIKCSYCDKVDYIKKHYHKFNEQSKNNKKTKKVIKIKVI